MLPRLEWSFVSLDRVFNVLWSACRILQDDVMHDGIVAALAWIPWVGGPFAASWVGHKSNRHQERSTHYDMRMEIHEPDGLDLHFKTCFSSNDFSTLTFRAEFLCFWLARYQI